MIRFYSPGVAGGRVWVPINGPLDLGDAVWIDVADPLPLEQQAVEAVLGLRLPTRGDMLEIEASSRGYQEGSASFMTATHVVGMDSGEPDSVPLAFVLTAQRLITVRYSDPHSFRSMTDFCTRHAVPDTPLGALLKLLDLVVDRTADILERMSDEIDRTSRLVFGRDTPADRRISSDDLRDILRRIGSTQYVVNKVHDSLLTFSRMMSFLNLPSEDVADSADAAAIRRARMDKRSRDALQSLGRDVASLVEHSSYLSTNIGFLLDAALGRISIEQNAIIKIFSVAAVVFLPPTLVASIYGMNFDVMPELKWDFGYPFAIALMILSAVVPYWFFKKKGWL
jgi:magnesium transporter